MSWYASMKILIKHLFLYIDWVNISRRDRVSQLALVAKKLPAKAGDVRDMSSIPESGRSLEEGMATHSSPPVFLLGECPWTEEPRRLQSIGSQRVGHDWATFTHYRAYLIVLIFQQLSIPQGDFIIFISLDSSLLVLINLVNWIWFYVCFVAGKTELCT